MQLYAFHFCRVYVAKSVGNSKLNYMHQLKGGKTLFVVGKSRYPVIKQAFVIYNLPNTVVIYTNKTIEVYAGSNLSLINYTERQKSCTTFSFDFSGTKSMISKINVL